MFTRPFAIPSIILQVSTASLRVNGGRTGSSAMASLVDAEPLLVSALSPDPAALFAVSVPRLRKGHLFGAGCSFLTSVVVLALDRLGMGALRSLLSLVEPLF